MAKVKVGHTNVTGDEAKKPPKRDPVDAGWYNALIVAATLATTTKSPILTKVAVQFQILSRLPDDGEDKLPDGVNSEKDAGRRVFQDYILEPDPTMPQMNEQRRYELRCLLDAAEAKFDDDGFDTDDLIDKPVKIKVTNRAGNKVGEDGEVPIFSNVRKVESLATVEADDLV